MRQKWGKSAFNFFVPMDELGIAECGFIPLPVSRLPGADRAVADMAEAHWPLLEGLVLWSRETDVQIVPTQLAKPLSRGNR
jgi:hypothetical protein